MIQNNFVLKKLEVGLKAKWVGRARELLGVMSRQGTLCNSGRNELRPQHCAIPSTKRRTYPEAKPPATPLRTGHASMTGAAYDCLPSTLSRAGKVWRSTRPSPHPYNTVTLQHKKGPHPGMRPLFGETRGPSPDFSNQSSFCWVSAAVGGRFYGCKRSRRRVRTKVIGGSRNASPVAAKVPACVCF